MQPNETSHGQLAATPAVAAARPIPLPRKAQASSGAAPPDDQPPEPGWIDVLRDAPPWLFSLVFHMLIVLLAGLWGLWTVVIEPNLGPVAVEVAPDEPRYAEKLGDQLHDEAGIGGPDADPIATEQVISLSDLPPVDNPLAAPPKAVDVSATGTARASDVDAPSIGMALTGREAGMKNVLLPAYGGNVTTESSVGRGLTWLVKQQQASGLWSLRGPYADGSNYGENTEAATAMALLALQGAGNTHNRGTYAKQVAKAWVALLARQDAEGNFARGVDSHSGALYTQAQCTIALCELYGMSGDSRYRGPAQKAVDYAIRSQSPEGGWRYRPREESDTSVTGWFVMGLQSARMAKLDVPDSVLKNVSRYLDAAQQNGGREYLYQIDSFGSPAMTAEGLLCRQYLGWKQSDPRLLEGAAALNKNRVNYSAAERDVYYWYYATQVCHHMENPIVDGKRRFIWKEWNEAMRQEVPSHQVKKGAEAGSWDPSGDKWGDQGGRLYVTCLSIYMLEVYYRHLPIYSSQKFMAAQ